MKYVNLFVFGCLNVVFAYGQDLMKELDEIARVMDTVGNMKVEVQVIAYAKKGGTRVYKTKSSVDYTKNASITRLDETEIYRGSGYQLMVDNEEKEVYAQKLGAQLEPVSGTELKKIQKVLENAGAGSKQAVPEIILLSDISGIKTYSVKKLTGVKELQVTLEPEKHKILRITYEYDGTENQAASYVELEYLEFEYGYVFLPGHFNLSNYLVKRGVHYVLAPRYTGYKLYGL